MFDCGAVLLGEPPASLVEQALRAMLDDPRRPRGVLLPSLHRQRFHIQLIGEPHGPAPRPAAEGADGSSVADPDAIDPGAGLPPLGRLLEQGAARLAVAAEAARERDRASARLARELAAFARLRPAALLDRPEEEIGAAAAASRAARPQVLTEVSEWAVDEVMAAFGVSAAAASRLLVEAVTLAELLPAILDAAERGDIRWAAAQMLAEVLPRIADPDKRAEVEAALLASAAGRTVSQLRVAANREVLRADPDAAARRAAAAIRERAVRLFTDTDGSASLTTAGLAQPVAAAIYRRLEALADSAKNPDDTRSRAQRMADVFVDLLLRGGSAATPPVQVVLTLVATADTLRGGDEPGEVDGHPLPAPVIREVAYNLGLLARPRGGEHATPDRDETRADSTGTDEDPATEEPATEEPATQDPATEDDDRHEAPAASSEPAGAASAAVGPSRPVGPSIYQELAADLVGLLDVRTLAGTSLAATPQIAIVEEFSGQLVALSDAGEIRRVATCGRARCRRRGDCPHEPRGPGLGPPAETPGYRPSDPLDRFVRARDRRCRFPGCRARPMRCDLDHNVPWPLGRTSHENLCCLCRHHHRLAHQAPGWRLRRMPDGGLEWTTPGGDVLITQPPRYGTDDQPPVQRRTGGEMRGTPTDRVPGGPARPGDEPAPF